MHLIPRRGVIPRLNVPGRFIKNIDFERELLGCDRVFPTTFCDELLHDNCLQDLIVRSWCVSSIDYKVDLDIILIAMALTLFYTNDEIIALLTEGMAKYYDESFTISLPSTPAIGSDSGSHTCPSTGTSRRPRSPTTRGWREWWRRRSTLSTHGENRSPTRESASRPGGGSSAAGRGDGGSAGRPGRRRQCLPAGAAPRPRRKPSGVGGKLAKRGPNWPGSTLS